MAVARKPQAQTPIQTNRVIQQVAAAAKDQKERADSLHSCLTQARNDLQWLYKSTRNEYANTAAKRIAGELEELAG